MMVLAHNEQVLENVRVPISMIREPGKFGGSSDKDCLIGDLVIRNTQVVGLRALKSSKRPAKIVIPRLTECHVHLDKCHTVSRMEAIGGDLLAAIEAQRADKRRWDEQDIRHRAARGLEELIASGCGTVRSHVDWNGGSELMEPPIAWQVLNELSSDYRDEIVLQISPLIGVDDLVEPGRAERIAELIAAKSNVMGVFVLNQPDRELGIRAAFAAADKYDLNLDFHVDEGLNPGLDGIELIAEIALDTGFEGYVLCGHACSLMNLEGDALKACIEKIAQSGIHIASLPTTNLYLQGRNDGTPDRRGVTRLSELMEAGVYVSVGTDNVCDAFCPVGRHDPRQSLMLAVLAAHLDPPLGTYLPMITTNAQKALGLEPVFVDTAGMDNLLMVDASSTAELLAHVQEPQPLVSKVAGAFA